MDEEGVTARGIAALEPYRVKRAVLLAAGFGSRLLPVTVNTPKPLARVHGVRIIDRLIDALLDAGISEIYISFVVTLQRNSINCCINTRMSSLLTIPFIQPRTILARRWRRALTSATPTCSRAICF